MRSGSLVHFTYIMLVRDRNRGIIGLEIRFSISQKLVLYFGVTNNQFVLYFSFTDNHFVIYLGVTDNHFVIYLGVIDN